MKVLFRSVGEVSGFAKFFLVLALVVFLSGIANSQDPSTKLSGALYRIVETYNLESPSGALAYAQVQGVEVKGANNTIVVVIEAVGDLAAVVKQYHGEIQAKYRALWQVALPIGAVKEVASFRPVHYIRLPLVASPAGFFQPSSPTDPPITEGLRLIGADKYHARGLKGQGIKIAIIDLGFAGLEESIAAGALPQDVLDRARDFTQAGDVTAGTSHGTAVAEIVHAIAPEAELYLYKVSTETELGNAVVMALDNGVQVINHSVGWFNDGFYAGDGWIANNIIKVAWRNGVLWVNAAGNQAQTHYEGNFEDRDGDGFHDEEIIIVAPQITSTNPEYHTFIAYLTWDGWPKTTENFDLMLEHEGQIIVVSDNVQDENHPSEPDERITYSAKRGEMYRLRIKWAGAGSPPLGRRLEMFICGAPVTVNPRVPESSIPAPGNAEWVVSVGAVAAEEWEAGILESFSSRGPTNDGRDKPDLVAPDKVRCFTYSQQNMTFIGTSAAAPHVAGMAALLLSEKPTLPIRDLYQELISRAWPVPGGARTEFGAGRASLVKPQMANLVITSVEISPEKARPGQAVEVQVRVKNQGDAECQGFWVALWKAEDRVPGNELDSYLVRPLSPGEACELTLVCRLPEGFASPELELLVTADPYGDVPESNEEDNERAVSLLIELPKPTLKVTPLALDFGELPVGTAASPLTIQVSNIGVGTLKWTAVPSASWLELEPQEGELDSGQSATATVKANTSNLAVGRYEATLELTAEGAEGSPQKIALVVTIYKPATLEVSPDSLTFAAGEDEAPPPPQTITVANPGGRPLHWTMITDVDWLVLSKSRGELEPGSSESIEVSVETAGVEFGKHEATLLITAPEVGQAEIAIEFIFAPAFRVVSVVFPDEIPADGTSVSGTVEFMGAHHVVQAIFEVVKAVSFSEFNFNPHTDCSNYTFDPATGKGGFGFSLYSNVLQVVELKLTLVDEEGNRTDPYYFTFECIASGD